jgi:selenoprotein W-related protein
LKEFEPDIQEFTLVPSDGGRFELSIDGKLLYSKLQTHRHMEPGEGLALVRQYLKEKS